MDPAIQKLWSKKTDQLNSYGIQKNCREWMETYKLMARKAKMKARNISVSMGRTGSGKGVDERLNHIEKTILPIEGLTGVYGLQQREAGVTRVEETVDDYSDETPSTFPSFTDTPPSPSAPPESATFQPSTSATSLSFDPSPPSILSTSTQ